MGLKYLWISAPELQSWKTICCWRQEGPWNGCVSQAWFMIGCSLKPSPFCAWVLFDFSGLCLLREWKKERKKYKERDGIWEKMKERKKKKKKYWNWKRRNIYHWRPRLSSLGVAVERRTKFLKKVPLHNNVWKIMLSSREYLIKKRATQHFFFFFLFVKAYTVQWITFYSLAACYKQLSKFND